MNFALSEQVDEKLRTDGHIKTDSPKEADYIIINACSVRKHAEDRVFKRIEYFKSLKKIKNFKIVIAGCFAQNHKDGIEGVDFVLGTYKYDLIPKIFKNGNNQLIDTEFDEYKFLKPVSNKELPFQSYVDITVGCDNFCTYCIVPYLRGPQISRASREIVEDVKVLADDGVKEIFLLGQNVNSYGKDNNDIGFAELLYRINEIEGIKRIKFLTSHPKDFDDNIIDAVFVLKKVSKWIHLPVQSGSDTVLKRMNRKYNVEHYMRVVDKIKSYNTDYNLSTDILVGFPGESEKDFEETVDFMKQVKFDEAFMFKYSDRPYTVSYKFENKLDEETKNERLKNIIAIQNEIEKENIKKHKGKVREVLIEKKSKRSSEDSMGRDELNKVVIVKNEVLKSGEFYKIKIKDTKGVTLIGELV